MVDKSGIIAEPDDGMKPLIMGHLLIRDKTSGKVLVNQRDNLTNNIGVQKGKEI